MKPTQEPIAEHSAVLVALEWLEKAVGALAARNQQAPEHLEHLLDFLKGFVDLCHHGKSVRRRLRVRSPDLLRSGRDLAAREDA